jgi:SAM-dependent methyltransferase
MTTNAYSALWFQLFMPLQTEEWTEKDVAFLARQLPLPRYARVLDLCCGYGRHALKLDQRGYQVTGLDRDEAAIDEARKRAAEAGQEIDYLMGDMRQVDELVGEFDAVINMWQSFCFFDEETNRDLLRQIHSKLTPGGRFIIDMYNREYFENHQGSQRQEINGITIESTSYMQGNRWHSIQRYSDESSEQGSDHFDWQMFSPAEFSAMAASLGFRTILACTWSDEQKTPSPEIARVQMVLEKM